MGNARKMDRLQAYVMKEEVLKHQETMWLNLEPGKRKSKEKIQKKSKLGQECDLVK